MDTTEYLYLVLLPVAEVFRKQLPATQQIMTVLYRADTCRIKFSTRSADKKWQQFCDKHGLKNDQSLEY